jgi:hypothetical protein
MSKPPVLPRTFPCGLYTRPDGAEPVVVITPGSGWQTLGGSAPFMLVSEADLKQAATDLASRVASERADLEWRIVELTKEIADLRVENAALKAAAARPIVRKILRDERGVITGTKDTPL